MSYTLCIRERPRKELHLKNPLATILTDKFGREVGPNGVEFLQGILAGLSAGDERDKKVIATMIDKINEGTIFDLDGDQQ